MIVLIWYSESFGVESRQLVARNERVGEGERELLQKKREKTLWVVEMLYIVIVVSFTLVGPIVITHQIVGLKCQVFIGCKLYLNKADPRIKKVIKTKLNILKPKRGVGAENIWSNEVFFLE